MQFKRTRNRIQCLVYDGYDVIKKRSKQRLIASISLYDNDIPEALNELLTEDDLAKLKGIREESNRLSEKKNLYVSQMKQLAESIANGAVIFDEAERVAILEAIDRLKAMLQAVADNQNVTVDDAAAALGVTIRSRVLTRARSAAREALNIHNQQLSPKQSSKIYRWIIAHEA